MLPVAMILSRVRRRGSPRPFRSPLTKTWVNTQWLTTVALGGEMSVVIAGESAVTAGVIVYQYQGKQVAARLNDQRLVKFIDGVRLRGNHECLAPPVAGG